MQVNKLAQPYGVAHTVGNLLLLDCTVEKEEFCAGGCSGGSVKGQEETEGKRGRSRSSRRAFGRERRSGGRQRCAGGALLAALHPLLLL